MLDNLLEQTKLSAPASHAQAVQALFGPCWHTSPRVDVWTDGSAMHGPNRTGAGIYYGPNSARNAAVRVPGTSQTNNRAELYAVLHVLYHAEPHISLGIHSDSQYVIHSICHWATRNAQLGWRCLHGDLLAAMQAILRARTAPVLFYWVKGHSGNNNNTTADELAKQG
ncbi:ribonuclease H-like protein, partial [Trametes sanguinea]